MRTFFILQRQHRVATAFQLFIGLLFSLSAMGQPAFLKDGLVAYYPFNGNANDESGNRNDGLATGITYSFDRNNILNGAVSFNGDVSRCLLPELYPSFGLDSSPLTASVWVKPTKNNLQNANQILTANACSPIQFRLALQPYDSGWRVEVWENGDLESANTAKTLVLPDKWTHICLVIDPIKQYSKVFINGFEDFSNTRKNVKPIGFDANRKWEIGAISCADSSHRSLCMYDEVRVYKRAFSDAEVKSLYAYESTPPNIVPVFVFQPQTQSVIAGNDATFCVTLKDSGTYNYQWQRNEQNIAGATLNCYTINSVTAAMDGSRYRVIVSNSAGTIISDSATLTVVTPPPPTIATQPTPKTVQEGANVSLSVVATGQGTLVYQWQFNEQNLPGATSSTLNLNAVKLNTAGRYRVLVSSQYGVTISDTVTLTVNPNPPPTIVTQPISRTPAEGTYPSGSPVGRVGPEFGSMGP